MKDGYLCHPCTRTLRTTIRQAPLWADQLGYVLARLTRYTDPSGPRHAAAPLPFNPAASSPARRLDAVLRATSRAVGAPGDVRAARLGVVAAWLAANVDAIRTHPDAPYYERTISRAVEEAMVVCDRPPDQWYAGACPECGVDMYPSTADAMVTCRCGAAWSAATRRQELLDKVRDAVAPGPVIARGLSGITDTPLTPDLLRKWRHAGKLTVRKMTTDPVPTNWYRVGDVIDLAVRKGKRGARPSRAAT